MSFDIGIVDTLCKYGKFINLMRDAQLNNIEKYNKINWKTTELSSKNLLSFSQLSQLEKNIKDKKYCVHTSNALSLNQDFICIFDNKSIDIIKKTDKNTVHKNTIGGIIFDHNCDFLNFFNSNVSKSKNIIISDVCPNIKSEDMNFIFKSIRAVTCDTKLSGLRLILYYPTNEIIYQLKKLITDGLKPPRVIWIVIPGGTYVRSPLNFNDIGNILFWNNETLAFQNNTQLISLFYKTNVCIEEKKNSLNIEKIKYKISNLERYLIDNNKENFEILDKISLCNLRNNIPKNIFDTNDCPICGLEFDDSDELSKTYMPCGHVYCPLCLITTLKIKHACPICRKIAKFNGISFPNLKSGKLKYLFKLINKLNEKYVDKNMLIYVDTLTIAKELTTYINSRFDKKCMMVKQRSYDQKSSLLVAPLNNGYLCQNIKNIKNVIILTNKNDEQLKPESLGYDFIQINEKVNVWLFEPLIPNNI